MIASATRRVLLDVQAHLSTRSRLAYKNHTFTVPPGVNQVGIALSYHNDGDTFIVPELFAPDGYRGARPSPFILGDTHLELITSPDYASDGMLPGPILPGEWLVRLDLAYITVDTPYSLEVWVDFGPVGETEQDIWPENHVVRPEAGWYRGELHCHSYESDGRQSVEVVVEAAQEAGLDFLAVTDHFTISQWRHLLGYIDRPIALLRSLELTTHEGHANLHGLKQWVDSATDLPDWSMNQAAAATRSQGALFGVNHVFSRISNWQALDFDWRQADLLEIYHRPSGVANPIYLPFWDRLLSEGRRVIGVGGTDGHNLNESDQALGKLTTWIYADELSESGLLAGLRRGQVYVSRGAEMRFSAFNGEEQRAQMWESLPLAPPVTLEVAYRSPEPLVLFVIRDGFVIHNRMLDASPTGFETVHYDASQESSGKLKPGFYRIELHAGVRSKNDPLPPWRDHTTARALSNPIWVGQAPPQYWKNGNSST
jgi:hypothetical protein